MTPLLLFVGTMTFAFGMTTGLIVGSVLRAHRLRVVDRVIHTKPLLYLAIKLQHTLIDRIWERAE